MKQHVKMSMVTGCFSKGWYHVTVPDNSIEVDNMILVA